MRLTVPATEDHDRFLLKSYIDGVPGGSQGTRPDFQRGFATMMQSYILQYRREVYPQWKEMEVPTVEDIMSFLLSVEKAYGSRNAGLPQTPGTPQPDSTAWLDDMLPKLSELVSPESFLHEEEQRHKQAVLNGEEEPYPVDARWLNLEAQNAEAQLVRLRNLLLKFNEPGD